MRYEIQNARPAARLTGALLVAVLAFGAGGPRARAADAGVHVELGAALREGANTAVIRGDGRVGFTAAYGLPESGDTSANQVYSFDTATGTIIDSMALGGYYPRQVVYNDVTGYVAVRHAGSGSDENGEFLESACYDLLTTSVPRDGERGGEFAVRFQFSVADPWAMREGVTVPAADALDDLAFTADGKILLYSNAVDLFAHDTQNGFNLPVYAVNALLDWDAGDQISFFTYTPTSETAGRTNAPVGVLSVGVTRTVRLTDDDPETEANEATYARTARVLNFRVWWDVDSSPTTVAVHVSTVDLGADGLSEGSNVYLDPQLRYGYVVGVDTGNLYKFKLETGVVRRTTALEGFAARPNDATSWGPRRVAAAASGRSIAISRPGNISRPTNRDISRPTNLDISRPTNRDISRPTNIFETPLLALVQVSERGRLTVAAGVTDFGASDLITNAVFDAAGENVYFATSDGMLHALSVATGAEQSVGAVGSGAWTLAFHASTGQLAVVNAMQTDEGGNVLDDGGVTLVTVGVTAASGARRDAESLLPTAGPGPVNISRPCGASEARSSTERGE